MMQTGKLKYFHKFHSWLCSVSTWPRTVPSYWRMLREIPYDKFRHAFEVLQELDGLRKTKQHCDFVIKVESKEIPGHQNVLCANSRYFKAMLSHDTAEKRSGVVELKDMDAECVIICMDFMYGRKIAIPDEKWEDIMHCADRLQLNKFCNFLEEFFKSALTTDTFYDIKRIASVYNRTSLAKKCDEFAPQHFVILSEMDGFNHLSMEFIVFLLNSKWNTASEMNKIKALLDWIKFDLHNRDKFLLELLKILDLSQIPVQHLRYLLENEHMISQSFECVKFFGASIMDIVGISASRLEQTLDGPNRIAIFDDTSRHLQCYHPEKNRWTQMHELHPDMDSDNFSAVALHNYIFVFMSDKAVYRLKYIDLNATWEQMSDMLEEHGNWPSAVTDTRYIYIVGCRNSLEMSSKRVERYDTITDNWTYLTQCKVLPYSSCVLLKRHIYCIGGIDHGEYASDVQILDLDSNNWTSSEEPLPYSGIHFGATTHLGKIYIAGGQDNNGALSSVECYDPEDGTWTSLLPIPTDRSVLPVITIGDGIFAIGEYSATKSFVDRYDIKDNKWKEIGVRNMKTLWCVGLHINS